MQCSDLTDDQLWRAIITNTNEMSALFDGQFAVRTSGPKFSISRAIDNLSGNIKTMLPSFGAATRALD